MDKLLETDWRDEYIKYHRARKAPSGAQFWDGRAKEFSRYSRKSAYTDTFIEYLELPKMADAGPVCSFLDMGSGSGTLAIPLAHAGHSVIAADFSPGMLAQLRASVEHEGVQGITALQLDFSAPWQDWQHAGLSENCVDVALASRSTIVEDMWSAFEKLEKVARFKVAVTLATGNGPRESIRFGESIAGSAGEIIFVPDYIFAMNILFQMDRTPVLRYINADKRDKEGNMQKIRWAFISWDVVR